MLENLTKCQMCPCKCGVDRTIKSGICGAKVSIKIALASVHRFEEPCISKINGSGTIFFTNCNLKCVFCQNYKTSQEGIGKEITIEKLAEMLILQQEKKVNNINLVTPTIYVYQIIEAIKIAKKRGLHIPIIYNSSGYENVETLKLLDGYIDVYLPDFKYYFNDLAYKYSGVKDYFENVTKSLKEMYRQVGNVILDKNGIIKKGLIIRHLILPNNIKNTQYILKWISENMSDKIYVSIMAQYFPTYKATNFEEIARKINKKELNMVKLFLEKYNLQNGYIQKLGNHEEEYVPDFNLDI